MGLSLGGLFGGDSGDSSSNSTQNYDQSHRESVASQSGASVLGSSNIVNDTGLVSIGLQNNSLATNIISHINDTNTALIMITHDLGVVADMADDRRQQIEPLQILFGLGDAIGQPRDRHADVRRHRLGAGAHALGRPIGVVTRLP